MLSSVLQLDSKGNPLNDPMFKSSTCAEYVAKASKIVTMVDLAGHEKYFKTTAYGLTGHLPDYACVIVGANAGVIGMCKEHLGVALALKVPVFFVITKTDICPKHILQNTVQVSTFCIRHTLFLIAGLAPRSFMLPVVNLKPRLSTG